MINDSNKALKFTHTLSYGDNTRRIVTGQNLRFMSIKINKDLEALGEWLIDHKLTPNVKKMQYMIFHHINMIVDYRKVELIIDNNTIEHVTQFNLLGVWLDNNLTFNTQCIKLRSSINSQGETNKINILQIACIRILTNDLNNQFYLCTR